MEKWEAFWRFTVTGLAVWRVSKLLIERKGGEDRPEAAGGDAQEAGGLLFWIGRVVDLACWISVWMSSQSAIWVTCGAGGVVLSRLAACGVARLIPREPEMEGTKISSLSAGDDLRSRNNG